MQPKSFDTFHKWFQTLSFTEQIQLERVAIDAARLELYLCFDAPASQEEISVLRSELEARFEGWRTYIACPEPELQPEKTDETAVESCRTALLRAMPSLNGFTDQLSFQLEGDRLTAVLPHSIHLDAFYAQELDTTMRGIFQSTVGRNVQIHVTAANGSDEIQEYVEQSMVWDAPVPPPSPTQNGSAQGNGEKKKPLRAWNSRKKLDIPVQPIQELTVDEPAAAVRGWITWLEEPIQTKTGSLMHLFDLYDGTGAVSCKLFTRPEVQTPPEELRLDSHVEVQGKLLFDSFREADVFNVHSIESVPGHRRTDDADEKRVELHLHTSLSALDGLIKPDELMQTLADWGHESVAITDHGVVQAFPDVAQLAKSKGIRPVYGMEAYVVPDRPKVFWGTEQGKTYKRFVVFDLETTGLSMRLDEIIEIGAVLVEDGEIIDTFSAFVKPKSALSSKIIELTGITDADLKDAPPIEDVLPRFSAFCEGAALVAHNAEFDRAFLDRDARIHDCPFESATLDTLALAQLLHAEMRSHRLDRMAKEYHVSLMNHHRATEDAQATAQIFVKMAEAAGYPNGSVDDTINEIDSDRNPARNRAQHVTMLVKSQIGMRNLYEMVSHSHLHTFFMTPRIPRSLLAEKREGLLLGTACSDGPLAQAYLRGATHEQMVEICREYDYVELQPHENWTHLIEGESLFSEEDLLDMQRAMLVAAQDAEVPVVATSDAHILSRDDVLLREIIKSAKKRRDAHGELPLFLRTTREMLDAFRHLGDATAREIVLENPKRIVAMLDDVYPILPGNYKPDMENSDEILRTMVEKRTHEIYGEVLPKPVEERMEKELHSIISNGYATLYLLAQQLVQKSNDDGYLVGSRGSVGSSFAATMAGITEVNPLPPHYICGPCGHTEFVLDGSVDSGIDLPLKLCPHCGKAMQQEGHDIPFEVFLGFEGNKEPDIDLNFAGEYQSTAHKFVESLFGSDKVIRAGTIMTIKEKTAFGYVKNYAEENGIRLNPAEIRRLQRGITEVKTTSAQHPGGIMIVPKDRDIHEFSPVQYPADSSEAEVITTHYSYKKLDESILKLDILGHDVPTTIRMLEDLTGTNSANIPLDDPETMRVFSGKDEPGSISTLGIPEFGTRFVQEMLRDTNPTTFGELIRISGLSHGTDVWLGNAKDLIQQQIAPLKECICTRDDIMLYLIQKGMDKSLSFTIMERVRKGKGLPEEMVEQMRAADVPEWYIDSCQKIKYMFPKAHAVAYVLMSYRIAWYKVHHPDAFYATFFSIRIADFPSAVLKGERETSLAWEELNELQRHTRLSAKEASSFTLLTAAREMFSAGVQVGQVELGESKATRFSTKNGSLVPPFRAVPGVSDAMASELLEEYEKKTFLSQDEMMKRTKLNKNALAGLREFGVLDEIPESDQLSFF